MQEMIEHVAEAIKGESSKNLLALAKDIASFSLETFQGPLLEKALMISAAVASFDAELNK